MHYDQIWRREEREDARSKQASARRKPIETQESNGKVKKASAAAAAKKTNKKLNKKEGEQKRNWHGNENVNLSNENGQQQQKAALKLNRCLTQIGHKTLQRAD